MKLEAKTDYNGIVHPILLTLETKDGRQIQFQQEKIVLHFQSFKDALGLNETVQTYMMESQDGGCFFHYMIDPKLKMVIIPPTAIRMDSAYSRVGLSEEIQRFFEMMAHKHQYRLMVGLTPQTVNFANGRVTNILRGMGWNIGPTVGESEDENEQYHVATHQSTDPGEGLPEYGLGPEYFIPSTVPKPQVMGNHLN